MVRVEYRVDARNEVSQRALERIGAMKEGTLRKHRRLPDGFIRDTCVFSVIDSEWKDVKARLNAMLL